MFKPTLFILCLAFLLAAGGFVPAGMALGALGLGVGVLTMAALAWQMLTR
jgi:hypothetical protein